MIETLLGHPTLLKKLFNVQPRQLRGLSFNQFDVFFFEMIARGLSLVLITRQMTTSFSLTNHAFVGIVLQVLD